MAVVYPSASGNWSDAGLWMEVGGNPYNQIPQVGDVVYLNGCTMTADMNIDLGTNGEIRNDGDAGQGISAGGVISRDTTGGVNIVSNIYVGDTNFFSISTTTSYGFRLEGNIYVIGAATTIYNTPNSGNQYARTITIIGDIYLGSASFTTYARYHYNITGNIYAQHGVFENTTGGIGRKTITGNIYLGDNATPLLGVSGSAANTLTIVGDIIGNTQALFNGNQTVSTAQYPVSISGDITLNNSTIIGACGVLTINGDINQVGSGKLSSSYITTLNLDGTTILSSGGLSSNYITTLNLNGTLTQGQGQIASYITTLNLDGTLNLSGTRPFTYGVQNLNVATGGRVTYDNHLYYCFTNIVAVDSNFTITCRNQNLDNFDFKNKNLLNNTYPAQANVSDGYVYGLEDQFTGSYSLPPESVVLEGTPYGSHVGTLALDISSSVQSTIDDIEDEVNILVDSYPPLVTLESITNIGNTSATINLSVSNTALITKTGAEVDTDWNFSNPYEYEVNNWATSVNVTGLNPSVQYYVRGYVIYDGNKVYSSANTLQTLLLPPQLQLCEYLQTDGNSYINIYGDEVIPLNNYSIEIKYSLPSTTSVSIFGCREANGNSGLYSLYTGTANQLRLGYANTQDQSLQSTGANAIQYWKNNTVKVTKWDGTVLRNASFTISSNNSAINFSLFGYYDNSASTFSKMLNGGKIMYSNIVRYGVPKRLVSSYVKTGETYEDNKGNTCSAGTCGMCDILTGTFYTNDGGGDFTHGNDII